MTTNTTTQVARAASLLTRSALTRAQLAARLGINVANVNHILANVRQRHVLEAIREDGVLTYRVLEKKA